MTWLLKGLYYQQKILLIRINLLFICLIQKKKKNILRFYDRLYHEKVWFYYNYLAELKCIFDLYFILSLWIK